MDLNTPLAAPAGEDGPVIVTGASGGIGLNLTAQLLHAGWRNLVCQYRSRPDEIAALLESNGLDSKARLFAADLTQEDQAIGFRHGVEESFGPAYGLVNVVGGSTNRLSWKMSVEEFRQVMDMNVLTTFLACREFSLGMRERGRGRIINISSVVAYTGAAGASHYSAAKAAVVGFSRSIAQELAPKNIAVSVVALGYFQYGLIHTLQPDTQEEIRRRIPAQRFGTAAELGGLVDWLLGAGGAYAGGQVYHLNGGLYS